MKSGGGSVGGLAASLFLAAAMTPVLGETQLPVHSTFQTPPPPLAEAPPGRSFLGVHLPSMPQLKLPDGMSLPEMLTAASALPEKVGLPSANHVIEVQFDKLIQKLNIAIPAVESLGYEVRNFEVDWTLPPQIKVRLQSSEAVTDEEYEHVLASIRGDFILESIILSLGGVRKIQRASGLAPFKRAQIEVDMGIPPKVVMIFSDPTNKFHDRFVERHDVLQKAVEEAKAKAKAKVESKVESPGELPANPVAPPAAQ